MQSVLRNSHSKGAESISISGKTAGCHRLSVLETQEGLTRKEWPNPPLGTGPDAPFITGRDHLQTGSIKDPSRGPWAFGSDALRMEKIKELFVLPQTPRGPFSLLGLLLCPKTAGDHWYPDRAAMATSHSVFLFPELICAWRAKDCSGRLTQPLIIPSDHSKNPVESGTLSWALKSGFGL